jgi:DNA-directed RNA polymerase specialized sigma24 family protein
MIRELKFKMLCQRHADDVYRFSRSILRNAEDAEDATQEILLKLWSGNISFLSAYFLATILTGPNNPDGSNGESAP